MRSHYRLAPTLAARLLGAGLVLVAVLALVITLLAAWLGWPAWTLLVVGAVAVVGVAGFVLAVRQVPVLALDESGYQVRWVRGAGVRRARWRDVQDAVTASPRGVDCLVLRLRAGGTTSIPVVAVDADRDELVAQVRRRLSDGEGLRPL